ncbi:serine/threonine-protein phosphatase 6 regulatory subunit 3 isoform X2 [Fopius arisanus]|uniref:PPP6R3_2 protein n=1 Tax=Fopius arisanus TaxID=64838 RepID=A0A0C9QPY9_9HYME|nr:PREDICTED: serine/threonine-protein phosphatase 6 regulatory subunit 3 isoform X2 [Fopius arisanus]
MFWTNIYALSPHIEALLNKEDITLHELMDQEEIVAECKSQNKKLVDFLTKPEVIEELVTLTTKEPSNDVDERWRYKYPNVACELLTCNVPTLNEKLAGSEALLAKLYTFIDTDKCLNPLLASFFSKIIGVLLIRKSDQNWYSYQFMCLQVLEFLKSRQQCVDRLLQHLETSAIMDLVLKLVTKVEGTDMRQNILNWLDSQHLIQQLIKILSPTMDSSRHGNASQLLCDIIKSAREFRITCTERTDPDPILNTLESEETVSLLLSTILSDQPVESSIVGGIEVLLVLLSQGTNNMLREPELQENNPCNDPTDTVDRVKIQNATLPYLEKFHKLLLNPPPKAAVRTTAGLLEKPLGNTRLHIAKLLSALLATENVNVFQKLAELGTFQTLLDLFFKYSWNNFLHTQVEQCLALVINGNWEENSQSVYMHIFSQCKLIQCILDAWTGNDTHQNTEKGIRQGYMGHLINIANNIVHQTEKCENLDTFLKVNISMECLVEWEKLVNTQLAGINETHQILLGGKDQSFMTSTEDNSEEYSYSQDAYIQQGQLMTSHFIEDYGFHDDEFNDGNDALQPSNSVDQLTTMPFALSETDLAKTEDIFNKICQQKQKSGLDEGGVEWGDEGDMTFQTVIDKRDWPFKQQRHDSTSSDEDEETKDLHMEIDSSDPWDSAEAIPSNIVLPQVNPWDVAVCQSEESAGWANFDNFESTLNIASPPESQNAKEAAEQGAISETAAPASPATLNTAGENQPIVQGSQTDNEKKEKSIIADSLPANEPERSKSNVEEPEDKPRALTAL